MFYLRFTDFSNALSDLGPVMKDFGSTVSVGERSNPVSVGAPIYALAGVRLSILIDYHAATVEAAFFEAADLDAAAREDLERAAVEASGVAGAFSLLIVERIVV